MNNQNGGKTIASGGFGCVFSPALKCKNKKIYDNDSNKYVSKLMLKSDGLEEYNQINNIKEKLKNIKNYFDYFLIDNFVLCEPDKLSLSDLTGFTKKCSIFSKKNINCNNINNHLNKFYVLTMPNGGIQIDSMVQKTKDSNFFSFIFRLNQSLIKLFQNGILIMNKNNIYHSDIKDSNILIQNSEDIYPKLIDWGISVEYIPFKNNKFPDYWKNRPFIFNNPFSIIIFTDAFIIKYTDFLKKNKNMNINKNILYPFVLDYLHFYKKIMGNGHLNYINQIMSNVFNNNTNNFKNIENDITFPYMADYIINILLKFTKFRDNGTLNLREYLDNIFIHNIDIWGFCLVYYPIYEILFNNYNNLTKKNKKSFEKLKLLFIYLFTTPMKLSINKIIYILSNFSKSINNIHKNTVKKKTTNNLNKTIKNII